MLSDRKGQKRRQRERETLEAVHGVFERVYFNPLSAGTEIQLAYDQALEAFKLDECEWQAALDTYYDLVTGDAVVTSLGGPTEQSLARFAALGKEIEEAYERGDGPEIARLFDLANDTPTYLMEVGGDDAERGRKLQAALTKCRLQYDRCIRTGGDPATCRAQRRACETRARRQFGGPGEGGGEGEGEDKPEGGEDKPKPAAGSPEAAAAAEAERKRRRQKRIDDLSKDPDHEGADPSDEAKREAEVAVGLEESGKLKGVRRPPASGQGDFIDEEDQHWDVKSPKSRSKLVDKIKKKSGTFVEPPAGEKLKGEFEVDKMIDEIKEQKRNGRKVIIDTEDLTPDDLDKLKKAVNDPKNNLGGDVIYYP